MGGPLGAPGKLERSAYIPGRPNPLTAWDRKSGGRRLKRRMLGQGESLILSFVPHTFLSACVPGTLQELRGLDEDGTSLEEFTFYLGKSNVETRQ